jgi:hypothetical protein
MTTLVKRPKRGYLYYIFPVDVWDDGEVEATDGIMWVLFFWLFWLIKVFMSIACQLTDTEPQFLIYIPKQKTKWDKL